MSYNIEQVIKDYSKYNIHELRVIGANLGVKAPSTLKKEKLINEIIAIEVGEKTPYFSNRGRHRKVNLPFNPNFNYIDRKNIDKKRKDLENKVQKAIKLLTEIYENLQDLT